MTLTVDLPSSKYPTDVEENLFYESVLERVRVLPGVVSAAGVNPLPLNFESYGQSFTIEGRAPAEPGEKLHADAFWVTADYFKTLGIALQKGRGFTEKDNDRAAPVVIINQQAADRFWPGEDPIGRQIRLDPGTEEERAARVVGLVGNTKHFLMNEEPAALLYLPQLQDSSSRRFLVVRAAEDPLALADSVRRAVWAADPYLPVTDVRSMEQVLTESLAPWSGGAVAVGVVGLGAVLLAAMGLYGVMAFSVGQRIHEVGVRIALGARRGDVIRWIVRQGMLLTGIGVAIGLAAALGLARLIQALLYGVGAMDPVTFVATPSFLVAVALVASTVPALRAARAHPLSALRYE